MKPVELSAVMKKNIFLLFFGRLSDSGENMTLKNYHSLRSLAVK
jgi:hypothetical protein